MPNKLVSEHLKSFLPEQILEIFYFIIIWLVFVSDITSTLSGILSLNCKALFSRNAHGLIMACARTIGFKVITSATLALAFLLYFCVPYNKQLNNLHRSYKKISNLGLPY